VHPRWNDQDSRRRLHNGGSLVSRLSISASFPVLDHLQPWLAIHEPSTRKVTVNENLNLIFEIPGPSPVQDALEGHGPQGLPD
jgi:hypothetical protein